MSMMRMGHVIFEESCFVRYGASMHIAARQLVGHECVFVCVMWFEERMVRPGASSLVGTGLRVPHLGGLMIQRAVLVQYILRGSKNKSGRGTRAWLGCTYGQRE